MCLNLLLYPTVDVMETQPEIKCEEWESNHWSDIVCAFLFFFLLKPLKCMLRQSRGRHLNHGYHTVIQSQLPIFNNFAHFLHIDDLFPCFWKFSGFGLVAMLDDGEPRINTLLTVETFRFRDENRYIFNQGGKTKILSHLPKLFSKNSFFCFTFSWGP